LSERYPHVFSPIEIGPVTIANRFYVSPHGIPLTVHGAPSPECVDYLEERAAGGCGLIIHSIAAYSFSQRLHTAYFAESVPGFAAVARAVHEHGAKIFGEIFYHASVPGPWKPHSPTRPAVAPSSLQHFDSYYVSHQLNMREIAALVEAHRRSAAHLVQAGYDGIEVHCTHGTLVELFLSPYFNRRTDSYGGSLENRMRFLVDCLQAARDGAGAGRAVGVRFICDEMLPGGLTREDARDVMRRLIEMRLIDFADLDIGVEPQQLPIAAPPYFVPPHLYESYVAGMREVTGALPVLSVIGRMTSVADAERIIAAGVCDMVGAARGLIAEPELVKNAREGREDRSRVCIACNWCIEFDWTQGACTINPASANEHAWGVRKLRAAPRRCRVVVVGAGPGGLEAARVAALRGHDVVVFERRASVGGQMSLWARLPGRETFATTPAWWAARLEELGVDVRIGVEADAALVRVEQPDAVIVAAGARYARDGESGYLALPIQGWDREFILTPEDVLEHGARPRGKVVVLDDEGLNTGVGIAELLANSGATVELMTRWLQIPSASHVYTAEFMFTNPLLQNAGVTVTTQTYIKEIGAGELTVFDVFTSEERQVDDVDAVVLATMRRPNDALVNELDGTVEQLFAIGDALAPRMLAAATYEGQRFARFIGEPDAPRDFADVYFAPPGADARAPQIPLTGQGSI
jgi:2,4-dienoyl-CoA reductase-like NADH-dependent reductase (Old Yellow Enzyme family)/thioredoxin reductase